MISPSIFGVDQLTFQCLSSNFCLQSQFLLYNVLKTHFYREVFHTLNLLHVYFLVERILPPGPNSPLQINHPPSNKTLELFYQNLHQILLTQRCQPPKYTGLYSSKSIHCFLSYYQKCRKCHNVKGSQEIILLIRIRTKIQRSLLWLETHLPSKFHGNLGSSFCVNLQTNRPHART